MKMKAQRVGITTANFEPVVKHLADAIQWLNSEQPENAVMSHHGIHLQAAECNAIQVGISLAPSAVSGRPVLVFDKPYVEDQSSVTGMSPDCFTPVEIEVIRQGIASAGGEIHHAWNGVGFSSASFALAQFAGKDVVRLVLNYSQHMRQYGFSWPTEITALYGFTVKPECWH